MQQRTERTPPGFDSLSLIMPSTITNMNHMSYGKWRHFRPPDSLHPPGTRMNNTPVASLHSATCHPYIQKTSDSVALNTWIGDSNTAPLHIYMPLMCPEIKSMTCSPWSAMWIMLHLSVVGSTTIQHIACTRSSSHPQHWLLWTWSCKAMHCMVVEPTLCRLCMRDDCLCICNCKH